MKMSWTGSAWALYTEGDTGTSTAHFTMTATRVLSALTMAGFAVSQAVQEGTSILLVGVKSSVDIANKQRIALNKVPLQTGQTSGSASTQWSTISRVSQNEYLTNWDGELSQEDLESLREYSYHTLTTTEVELNSSRYDTLTEASAVSHSLQDARREYMERNALEWLNNTSVSQREVETQSSSECVESQQSLSPQQQVVHYYGTSQGFVSSEEPYSWQSAIETRQGTSSSITYGDIPT